MSDLQQANRPSSGQSTTTKVKSSKVTTKQQQQHALESQIQPIDSDLERYPFCIVWTPIPILTWFIPIIGHAGIANSKGVIYDFSDDYNISVDNFAFGRPTKYYQLNANKIPQGGHQAWDQAIQETSDHYCRTRHNLFYNNCHQYIAGVLNKVKYKNRSDWNQVDVWKMLTFKSSYTGIVGFVRQWWPFAVIVVVFILLITVVF